MLTTRALYLHLEGFGSTPKECRSDSTLKALQWPGFVLNAAFHRVLRSAWMRNVCFFEEACELNP